MVSDLVAVLRRQNPWWRTGGVPPALLGLSRGIPSPPPASRRVLVLTGPRRAGKTTLLRQRIDSLLHDGIPQDRILYASLDHPAIAAARSLGPIVESFRALHNHADGVPLHLFLDEVHRIADWATWVKALFDEGECEVTVTGSSAALVEPAAMAGLTGRHRTVTVWPLGFAEFLEFRGEKDPAGRRWPRLLEDYLETGGFPEAVLAPSPEAREEPLNQLFADVLQRDLVAAHGLRHPGSLEELAVFLAHHASSPVSLPKLARTFSESLETLRSYLRLLELPYLFVRVPFDSRSANERIYRPKKYYPCDTGMRFAITGRFDRGSFLENAAVLHAVRGGLPVSYWRGKREVDLVCRGRDDIAAIECSISESVDDEHLEGLAEFAKREKKANLVLVTGGEKGMRNFRGSKIRMVPAWEFLRWSPQEILAGRAIRTRP